MTAVSESPVATRSVVAELRDTGKRFGATWALRDVNLTFRAGEIHGLVGENGAGKSTCLGMIAGRFVPSEGQVLVLDQDVTRLGPRQLRELGVSAVYQELNIFPQLSVAQNLALGKEPSGPVGWLSRRSVHELYRERSRTHGVRIRPGQRAGALSIAARQMLELMRGLDGRTRMLLLDEPTAALPPAERERLFRLVREQRDAGVAVVFVSHNLNEVLDLADVVSVFRNGRHIETKPATEWTEPLLVAQMVGREVDTARRARVPRMEAPTVLTVSKLHTPTKLHDVSFELRQGEILGIAGLAGSGRSTALRALAGDIRDAGGEVSVNGKTGRPPKNPVEALRRGLAFLPEDRRRDGLFLPHPAWRNIIAGDAKSRTWYGGLNVKGLMAAAKQAAERSAFNPARLKSNAGQLSGGNQQKLLVARPAHKEPIVLLADEPTRGVDIGARADIWRVLQDQSAGGLSIVVVSSELEELLLACDRVLILSKGRIVEEIKPDDESVSVEAVLQRAFDIGGSLEG